VLPPEAAEGVALTKLGHKFSNEKLIAGNLKPGRYELKIDGTPVGTLGAIGAFSLQQGKHMTSGEGGVVVARGDAHARRVRLFSDKAQLGQPVVIRNVTGAGGTIGTAEVARARPDGQTILFSPVGPVAIQPHFRSDLPYRTTDFASVCQVGDAPVVLMTAPATNIRSMADLMQRARSTRGGTSATIADAARPTMRKIDCRAASSGRVVPIARMPMTDSTSAAPTHSHAGVTTRSFKRKPASVPL
jgi:hypothetical protein